MLRKMNFDWSKENPFRFIIEVSYGIDLGAVLAEQNIQEPATLAGVRSV